MTKSKNKVHPCYRCDYRDKYEGQWCRHGLGRTEIIKRMRDILGCRLLLINSELTDIHTRWDLYDGEKYPMAVYKRLVLQSAQAKRPSVAARRAVQDEAEWGRGIG